MRTRSLLCFFAVASFFVALLVIFLNESVVYRLYGLGLYGEEVVKNESVSSLRLETASFMESAKATAGDDPHNQATLPRFENNQIFSKQGKTNIRFSSFICANGVKPEFGKLDWKKRSCLFHNVGFVNKTLIFHQNPAEEHNWGAGYELNEEDLFSSFAVPVKRTPLSIHAFGYPSAPYTTPVVISALDYIARPPGHDISVMWSVFDVMVQMGMLGLDNHLLLETMYKGSHVPISKFWKTLAQNVSDLDAFIGRHPSVLFSLACLGHANEESLFRFSNGYLADIYRRRAYALLGLDLNLRNASPVFLVRQKEGRHRFTNHPEIVQRLRQCCKTCAVYELEYPSSIHREMQQVAEADVYITPSGGGSFSAFFLRNGCSALFAEICYPTAKKGTRKHASVVRSVNGVSWYELEGWLWDTMTHIFREHLPCDKDLSKILESETWGEKTDHVGHSWPLNVTVLDRYAKQALERKGFNCSAVYNC